MNWSTCHELIGIFGFYTDKTVYDTVYEIKKTCHVLLLIYG